MVRILSIAAAVAAASLSTAGAYAQAPGGYYVATPAAKPTKTSFLTRETQWKWADGAFVAKKSPERDIILCSLVAQRAGKLTAFTVNGTAMAADALEKCNARAS